MTPNFIIILADDMGYGDSSAYGGWIKTPGMERMAAEGLKFTDFHSSGVVCSPTRAGLLTGLYQQRVGVPGVINADPEHPSHNWGLDPGTVTFPKLLRSAGYRTAIFGKWHLGYDTRFNPVHHGFDRFRGYVSGNVDYISHYSRMGQHDWWDGLKNVPEKGYTTHLINRHAVEFIERHRKLPFCLFVSHEAVHTPFQAPDDQPQRGPGPLAEKPIRDKPETYCRMMQEMDTGISQVLEAVEQAGIADRTLVFFFSDNGAELKGPGSNAPFRGGKGQVYEGGHRMPALAWWPGTIQPRTETTQLSISLDLMPTILELADVTVPEELTLDGIGLGALLTDGWGPGSRRLFWNGAAMRDGNWKLLVEKDGPALFDLAKDIGEEKNVAAQLPDRVKTMQRALDAWKQDVGVPGGSA